MSKATQANQTGPQVGDKALDFSVENDQGHNITLASLKGKKVVLYFYPKDDTPGCTTEAKDFRDMEKEFADAGAVILGVSKDSVKSHCNFRDKYDLNFQLLSDADGAMCDAYGVWVEKSMYGKKYMGIQRATFVINEQGVIHNVWPKVSVTGHAKEVLDFLKKM